MIVKEKVNSTVIRGAEEDPVINSVKNKVKKYRNLPLEKHANWVDAGEGNFSKTKNSGKYRDSCNTLKGLRPLKKCDSCGDVKKIISYCNKLDCSSCFSWTSHNRAERVVEKHSKLEEEAKKRNIRIGKPSHVVFSPKKNLSLFLLINRSGTEKLLHTFKEMLKNVGLHSGTVVFHLRSIKCKKCKNVIDYCNCGKEQELHKALNPHFHVFSYGFIDYIPEFKKNHPNWNYIHEGKLLTKKDLFKAVFYAISKCSFWRKKEDGKTLKSYSYFGYLLRGLKKVKEQVKLFPDKCECKGTYHYIEKGYEIKGDLPKFDEKLSIREVAKQLGMTIINLTDEEIEKRVKQKVLVNNNLEITINNEEVELGKPIMYRKKVRQYKLVNVRAFKKAVKESRKKYVEQRKKLRKARAETIKGLKEGRKRESNGYG